MHYQFEAVPRFCARYNVTNKFTFWNYIWNDICLHLKRGPEKVERSGPRQHVQSCAFCVIHTSGKKHTASLQFATKQKRCCNYFWSNQRQCFVSLSQRNRNSNLISKTIASFYISDGCLLQFVGGRGGGGPHCCLFQAFNNWEAGISLV